MRISFSSGNFFHLSLKLGPGLWSCSCRRAAAPPLTPAPPLYGRRRHKQTLNEDSFCGEGGKSGQQKRPGRQQTERGRGRGVCELGKKVDYWKVLFILCVYYALRLPNNDHGQKYFVYWTFAAHVNFSPSFCTGPLTFSLPPLARTRAGSQRPPQSSIPNPQSPLLSKEKTGKIMRCRSFYRLGKRRTAPTQNEIPKILNAISRLQNPESRIQKPKNPPCVPAYSYINFIKFAALWHLGLAVFTSVNYFQFGSH